MPCLLCELVVPDRRGGEGRDGETFPTLLSGPGPSRPPHPSLLGFKKPLVIQEFPNSMSLPCSIQAAKHGFRDPEPYYLFLNTR